jgi:replication-associated recombination protein RarA
MLPDFYQKMEFSKMPQYKIPHDLRAKNRHGKAHMGSGVGYNYNSSLQMGQNNRNVITVFSSTYVPNRRMVHLWASKNLQFF